MGRDELIARLERDAAALVAAIDEAGEADARACLAQADTEAAQRSERLLAQRASQRREAMERELADTRRRLRSELLRAQHALLERIFERALELSASMADDPALLDALEAHLHELLRYLGERDARLSCPPGLFAHLQRLLAGRAGVELVADPSAPPGVSARAPDGSLTIDNTLAARLQRVRPMLEPEMLREAIA